MHVLKQLHGEEAAPDERHPQPEAIGSTNINAFGRLYHTILLTHGHVVSLSVLVKRGTFKKRCYGLSKKPLYAKGIFLVKVLTVVSNNW